MLRRVAWGLVLLTTVILAVRALPALSHWAPPRNVFTTRLLAVAYVLCDVAIGSSLVILLIVRGRRPPEWVEQRLPLGGRWVWPLLLVLTALLYAGLAPTFLFFYLQTRH
jgi:hypothetical protein